MQIVHTKFERSSLFVQAETSSPYQLAFLKTIAEYFSGEGLFIIESSREKENSMNAL